MRKYLWLTPILLVPLSISAAQDTLPTHADTLRGSITPERAWWDVAFYDLRVRVNPVDSTIRGVNRFITDTWVSVREVPSVASALPKPA